MKKILMLLERDFPPDGRVEKEALSLIKKGYEVHIACLDFGNKPADEVYHGIHLHRRRIHRQVFKKSVLLMNIFPFYLRFWKKHIRKITGQHQFFAIHVHDLPLCGLGMEFARQQNAFYIADMHENYPFLMQEMELMRFWLMRIVINVPLWKSLERKWLAQADRIVVTCPEMKERLAALGIGDSKIFVVENTLPRNTDIIAGKGPDKSFITMVYIGGINLHRGIHIALEGFARIRTKYPTARFWIIGDGKYLRTLKEMVKNRHIEGVTFFGHKPRKEADELILQADIGIIPHKKSNHTDNTSPNKIFEYFQMGKPVIVSDCNYLKRVIRVTGAGEVFDHSSGQSFEEVFYKMVTGNMDQYGENARNAILHQFNWEKTEESLHKLYFSLSN